MKSKTILTTGANSGIGKATAMGLAKLEAKIIMVCRNEKKGVAAMEEIIASTNNKNITLEICDLSSQQQIKQLAERIQLKHKSLDVLINNAGAVFSEYKLTEDGIERTWAVNYLSYFLLTNLLLDLLKSAPKVRIINVASDGHKNAKIQFDDPGLKNHFFGLKAYGQSKLANIMFTYHLARQLEGANITVNSLHPGGVATPIGQKSESLLYRLGWTLFMKTFAMTPEEGAATSIFLASASEVEGISGKYWEKCKPIKSSPLSYDMEQQERLWDLRTCSKTN